MPRTSGVSNYKNSVLVEVVQELLPNGAEAWKNVAIIYKNRSNEAFLRDSEDIKRHWFEKCCNKNKKPTGKTGSNTDFVFRCQQIQLDIISKTNSAAYGFTNSDEDSSLLIDHHHNQKVVAKVID